MVKKKFILNDTFDSYNLIRNEINLEKVFNSGILYCGKLN